MSISMCESIGVPSVSTIASDCAASAARAETSSCTRASSSSVPGSLNGMRRERTASSRSGSLSMPSTLSPASANAERERQADPAEADDRRRRSIGRKG